MSRLLILSLSVLAVACAKDDDAAATDAGGAVLAAAAERALEVPAPTPTPTPITEVPPTVEVRAEELAYGASAEHNLEGYFVLPADVAEPVPGIIVIHEGWGLNDDIRALAGRLAGEGYAVLAVDLFGGRTAATPAEADLLMAEVMADRQAVLDNIGQAHDYLDQTVLAPRTASLGWSLGGGWSLETGIALADALDAVVMFYGQVITREDRLAALEAPLLGLFAELDQSIPVAAVQQFRGSLRALGKSAEVRIFSGVDRAFANPSGDAYDHKAAEQAWALTLEFLDRELR
jgi:carboxymethylenebutenolidase